MREWLPVGHPLWVMIEAVRQLDTTACHRHRRTGGVGRAGFDPDMLLTLLMWAWAQGVFSSRRIERCCQQDISFRIICAGDVPDHVTIARFRAEVADAMEELFAQVLLLCRRIGMGQLGVIALDGVKIGCDASMSANRTEDALVKEQTRQQEKAAARAAARRAAAAHVATDAAEDALFGQDTRGDDLPAEAADPSSRAVRVAAALADLRAERDAEHAATNAKAGAYLAAQQAAAAAGEPRNPGSPPAGAEVQVAQARLQEFITDQRAQRVDYAQRLEATQGKGIQGVPPKPVEELYHFRRLTAQVVKAQARVAAREAKQLGAKAVRNITDPDSRLMTLRGGGWLQGYNCQAVTSQDGLIIATSVNNSPSDVITYQPMSKAAEQAAVLMAGQGEAGSHPRTDRLQTPKVVLTKGADLIGLLLADTGYLSTGNLRAAGPRRLIAVGKSRAVEKAARLNPAEGLPPADADPIAAMAHQLRTPEGIAQYRQRSHIAETPFGHAKHNLGFRRFTSRGLPRAQAEWAFHGAVHNLFKAITTGHLTPEKLATTK